MEKTHLIVGVKQEGESGKLTLHLLEATPDETTIAEAVERQKNPDYEFIAAVEVFSTEEPGAAPKPAA